MKKTYESPSIKSHGDVRALTQGGPGSGSIDAWWDWRQHAPDPAS